MKLSAAVLISALAATSAAPFKTKSLNGDITADSPLGGKLLSKARRLDENEEIDYTWVAGMSVKFQGCFHVSQWNAEANGEDDVRIMTKRLVRFRLCPTDYCSGDSAGGCASGYGDYIIDLNTFAESYLEAKQEYEENVCKNLKENVCVCEDNGDDAWDEQTCQNECFEANGADFCVEVEGQENFEVNKYMECQQYKFQNNNGRRLEENQVKYYLGPYCANQGGDVYLGLFTDESCSQYADDTAGTYTYESLAGSSLPYSSKSIIGSNCVSCLKVDENNGNNNNNNNNDDKEDEATEMCQALYQGAGKCESGLSIDYPNENACTFMEGIKIIRKSGVVSSVGSAPSKTASAFIGIFAVSFCLLGCYVYYLKTKLDKAKINLADS